MLSIDMGGTKTAVLFENKTEKKAFEERLKKEYGKVKEKNTITYEDFKSKLDIVDLSEDSCISIYSTEEILKDETFFHILEEMNDEIPVLMSYPHTVCRIKSKNTYSIKNFSKFSKPFKLEVKLSLMLNDLTAFTFFYAYRFFGKIKKDKKMEEELMNLPNPIVGVQIGTGLNAFWITYSEFLNGSFMDKIIEAGHMTFKFGEGLCSCGRKGCAEHYLAGCGIEKRFGKKAKDVLNDKEIREEYEEMLSMYLSSLVLLYDPIKMVLGGSIIKSVDKSKVREKTYMFLEAYKDYESAFKTRRKQIPFVLKDQNNSFPLPIEFEESFFPNLLGVYLCHKSYFQR